MRLFVSSIIGRQVHEAAGAKAAVIGDLTTGVGQESTEVKRVILRAKDGLFSADARNLVVGKAEIILDQPFSTWQKLDQCPPEEVRLMEDILDKQVIDIENREVIRVNDVLLDYAPGRFALCAVCVGADSFLRRLTGERVSSFLRKLLKAKENLIDWHLVQPLGSSSSVSVK